MKSNSFSLHVFEKLHKMFQNCLQFMLTFYFMFQQITSLPPVMVSIKFQQAV